MYMSDNNLYNKKNILTNNIMNKTYTIGEKYPQMPYDEQFTITIPKNDNVIQDSLKKGYLFGKYIIMAIYSMCKYNEIIFDVGANIGSITIPCAKVYKVYAFEPFKQIYECLEKNVRQNNVNVKLFNNAVGHKNMKTTLSNKALVFDSKHRSKEVSLDENIEVNYGNVHLGESGQETNMITLDSLMKEVKKVSLIKVDVEGAEPLVFYGARNLIKRDLPVIIFEKNTDKIPEEIVNALRLDEDVRNFNIIEFCSKLGYNKLCFLHLEDYALIPPNFKFNNIDKRFQLIRVESIPQKYKLVGSEQYKLYKLAKIKWDRIYDNIETKLQKDINLREYSKAVYSQNGEDGIIDCIFKLIGTTNKYYVEFGTQDGTECNTRYLRERENWTGLLMDGDNNNKYINLHKEFITAENINDLFKKYSVPQEFDLLSIDIDGNDWYVWNNLKYTPRVVVIEYNSSFGLDDKIIEYKADYYFNHTLYFGASITALYNLGRSKGYSLVGTDNQGVNLFFIRNDLITHNFVNINNPKKLYVENKNILKYFKKVNNVNYVQSSYLLDISLKRSESYEPYFCKEHIFNSPTEIFKNGKCRYAYVTLLMIDDKYLPGVLNLGYSIRKMGSKIDTIVMITKDISDRSRKLIEKVYTKYIVVPYIVPVKGIINKNLLKRYPHYGKTFTKLNLLTLTEYEKVFFLDADSLVFKNFDSLFTLNPPAAVYYGEGKMHENNYKPRLQGDKYIWHTKYCECCDHGKKIPPEKLDVIHKNIYGVSTECMLLKPDLKLYNEITKELNDSIFAKKFPLGFLSDAGYITWKYRDQWTGIDPRFLGRRAYPSIDQLFGITLGGAKPWEYENIKFTYPDFEKWYEIYKEMIIHYDIKDHKLLELYNILSDKNTIPHVYVRIILPNESGGLLHDAEIYKTYFSKYLQNVTFKVITPNTNVNELKMDKHSNVNIFLESIYDKYVSYIFQSDFNLFMINHEFFSKKTLDMQIKSVQMKPEYDRSKNIDYYLCKTKYAVKFLKSLGIENTIYTSFTTLFPSTDIKKRYDRFFHGAGSSTLKNTDLIIQSWNDKLPHLYVTCYDRCYTNLIKYVNKIDNSNITLYSQKQDIKEIINLKNSIGYHLCPSMIEGFGHYLNEGRIVSAVILTIDAEPMNELIDKTSGILIPYEKKVTRSNGSYMYLTSKKDLLTGINKMLSMSDNEKRKFGENARLKYEQDTRYFNDRIKEITDIILKKLKF